MKRINKQSLREWCIAFALAVPLLVLMEVLDIPMKWRHAIGATCSFFGVVIYICQKFWKRIVFWIGLTVVFLLHSTCTVVFNRSLEEESSGFRGLPLIGFSMGELMLILFVLGWLLRRTRDGINGNSPSVRSK